MTMTTKSTRFHERLKLKIPLQVVYHEADEEWTENTETEELTVCGIGFTLSRPVEPKRLIHLRLPMPKNLRLFDYGKEQYEVWGMIRYLQLVESNSPTQIRLMIGTAAIGGTAPASFQQNPNTLYELKPILMKQSFWGLRELPRTTGPYMRSSEERRSIKTNVILEIVNEEGKITEFIEAETLNISESGMAVIAQVEFNQPKYILVKNETTVLLAAVRGAAPVDSPNHTRLHFEFISGKWLFD